MTKHGAKKNNGKRVKKAVKQAVKQAVSNVKRNRPRKGRKHQRGGGLGGMIKSAALAGASAFGGPIGRLAASTISRITGHGDYKVQYNSVMNPGQCPPAFASPLVGTRIRHREFIRVINSSVNYNNISFSINPGLSALFPWLSTLAVNFEQYKLHGFVATLHTTSATAVASTNTALGVWGAVTQYDPTDVPFIERRAAENYVGCNSAVVCSTLMHGVECKAKSDVLDRYYVRTQNISDSEDLKFYDHGVLNIFTDGAQASSQIGELWVSYDVEFFKPKLPSSIDMDKAIADFYSIQNPAGLLGDGSATPRTGSNLGSTISPNGQSITLPSAAPAGLYKFDWMWKNPSGNQLSLPANAEPVAISFAGLSFRNYFFDSKPAGFAPASNAVVSSQNISMSIVFYKSANNAGIMTLSPNVSNLISSGSYTTYSLARLPTNLTAVQRSLPNRLKLDEVTEVRQLLAYLKKTGLSLSLTAQEGTDQDEVEMDKVALFPTTGTQVLDDDSVEQIVVPTSTRSSREDRSLLSSKRAIQLQHLTKH